MTTTTAPVQTDKQDHAQSRHDEDLARAIAHNRLTFERVSAMLRLAEPIVRDLDDLLEPEAYAQGLGHGGPCKTDRELLLAAECEAGRLYRRLQSLRAAILSRSGVADHHAAPPT